MPSLRNHRTARQGVVAGRRASRGTRRATRCRTHGLAWGAGLKITRLRITIEPWHADASVKEFRVEAMVGGIVYNAVVPFEENDLESRFDCLFNEARREILKLIRR